MPLMQKPNLLGFIIRCEGNVIRTHSHS
uniref:Uncharacterized protein n=1 Tax=Rhizophora mucronata TaxID=61149 RepID=A0A2P2PDM7_RHIMU